MNRKFNVHPVYLPAHKRNHRTKRLHHLYPLLLLGFWLVGCDDDPLTDLSLLGTEVVQSASVSADAASLAAQRSTVVRVRLETGSSYDVTGVTGSLSVWVDGEVVATDRAAVNAPVTVLSARNRTQGDEDASLYFELDASADVRAGRDVDFFVTVTAPGQFVQGGVSAPAFVRPDVSANLPARVNPSVPVPTRPSVNVVPSGAHATTSRSARYPPEPGRRGRVNPPPADPRESPP